MNFRILVASASLVVSACGLGLCPSGDTVASDGSCQEPCVYSTCSDGACCNSASYPVCYADECYGYGDTAHSDPAAATVVKTPAPESK